MADITSLFVVCAAAIGIAQVVDCSLLLANKTMAGATATAFSVSEWLWGAVCLFVLVERPENLPLWLPAAFVAYLALTAAHIVMQLRSGRSADEFELTRNEALAGGIFGGLYALSALAVITGVAGGQ